MLQPGSPIPGMRRPPVNLTTDGPDNEYILPDGTDCLDNADQYIPECWLLLNITSWLPQWFLQTPQCKLGQSQAFCNIRNQTNPEPWTQTFMREADGGPGPDCTVIPNACPNSFKYVYFGFLFFSNGYLICESFSGNTPQAVSVGTSLLKLISSS